MRSAFPKASPTVNKVPAKYGKFCKKNKTNDNRHFLCETTGKRYTKKNTVIAHFHQCDDCEGYFAANGCTPEELWKWLGWLDLHLDENASQCSELSNVSNAGLDEEEKALVAQTLKLAREAKAKKAKQAEAKKVKPEAASAFNDLLKLVEKEDDAQVFDDLLRVSESAYSNESGYNILDVVDNPEDFLDDNSRGHRVYRCLSDQAAAFRNHYSIHSDPDDYFIDP